MDGIVKWKKIRMLRHPVDVVCALARAFDPSTTSSGVGIGEEEEESSPEPDKKGTMPEINGKVRRIYEMRSHLKKDQLA